MAEAAAVAVTAMTEYFQVQTILNQIPTFDGKEANLRTFALEAENALSLLDAGTDQGKFVKQILSKLRGIARESVEGKTFADLKSFIKHLKETFTCTTLPFAHYHTLLSQAKMSNTETVTEFGLKVKDLIKRCKAALSLVDSTALNGFFRGLRDELELRVAIHKPTTLDQAIEFGRLEEQLVAGRIATRVPSDPGPFPRPFHPPVPGQRNFGYAGPARPPYQPPLQPHSRSNGQFDPRSQNPSVQNNAPQRDELNRPFMAPRNIAHANGHFQPPDPRYADYPTRGTHFIHDWGSYGTNSPAYYPFLHPDYYIGYQEPYLSQYPSYYPGELPWGSYAPPLPVGPAQYIETKEGEALPSSTNSNAPPLSTTPHPTTGPLAQEAQQNGNLNSSSARPNMQETSAPPLFQPCQQSQTYTVMKASRFQNYQSSQPNIQK